MARGHGFMSSGDNITGSNLRGPIGRDRSRGDLLRLDKLIFTRLLMQI